MALVVILLQRGDRAAARAECTAILANDDKSAFARKTLAKFAIAEGDYPAARRALDRVIASDASDVEALYNRGVLASRAGDEAGALADFEAVRRLAPAEAFADYGVATVHALAGRRPEALAALARAVDKGIRDPQGVLEDPAWKGWEAIPEFQALLARTGAVAPASAAPAHP
jgi:tetratricopeptide (TPR) repeat protein